MTASSDPQVIFVGSGINSLVSAALLATRGKRVLVLERNDRLGGCIRTEELFPGYHHEVMSSWYPLFVGSPGYAELKPALEQAGLAFLCPDYTTGLVWPDGRGLALKQDLNDAVQRLEALAPGDGAALGAMAARLFGPDAALTFGLLSQNPYGWAMLKLLFGQWRKRGTDGLAAFAADALETFRRWSARTLRSDLARALIAPWVLHAGLGPDDAGSALIGKLTFASVVSGGMPVVKGGGSRLVEALARVIEQHGGTLMTGMPVEQVLTEGQGPPPARHGGSGDRGTALPRPASRGLQCHAPAAIRSPAARDAAAAARARRRLSLRARRHADPLRAETHRPPGARRNSARCRWCT